MHDEDLSKAIAEVKNGGSKTAVTKQSILNLISGPYFNTCLYGAFYFKYHIIY